MRQQWLPPRRCAFGARRQIARSPHSGIAKPHRQHRHLPLIVKHLARNAQPRAQTLAAGIVEHDARFMHFTTWRLTDNQNPRIGIRLHNRPWPQRQFSGADLTGAHLFKQCSQISHDAPPFCLYELSVHLISTIKKQPKGCFLKNDIPH